MCIRDSNNAADRYKHYVNGVEVQDVRSQGYANRNTGLNIFSNSTGPMSINSTSESGQKGNHYMSDFILIDGKALTPDVFGYFKDGLGYYSVGHAQDNAPSGAFQHTTGVWQPKAPRMIIAEINRQGGFGGNGCDTVGSDTLAIKMLFAKQVPCPGVSKVVVLVQI